MAKTRRGIEVRKLADTARGRLTDGDGRPLGPWQLLGVTFTKPPAEHLIVPERLLLQAYTEGWAELENPTPVLRPAGPAHAPWAGSLGTGRDHQFLHADAVTFKMVEGDYRYKVVRNPDKQHVNRVKTGGNVEGGEVWHDYWLDLEAAPKADG